MKKINRDYLFFLHGALIGIGGGFIGSLLASLIIYFITLTIKDDIYLLLFLILILFLYFYYLINLILKKIKELKNET